jgi:tRNA pseudouridine55 synthase
MGCGAHLSALRRTHVGKFRLEDAVPLDAVELSNIIPLHEALPPVPLVSLNATQVAAIRNGQPVGLGRTPPTGSSVYGMVDSEGEVIGMGRLDGPMLQPECVIPALEG